ncbi:MAG: hypothetical protein QOJ16_1534 [Acidobacteriota bacterium]|nr:hypothetical protein [Acidobacteriota bacterium]
MSFRELRNKAWAYWWVRSSGGRRSADLPLLERVAVALRAEPARAIFELEGIAFGRARAAFKEGAAPRGLLTTGEAAELPESSLILLHSGMGLGFASCLLPPLHAGSPAAATQAALTEFLDLCAASSRPAYLPVASEALGLFARVFRPRLIAALDAGLRRIAPERAAGFWHGVGRALYFRSVDLLPGSLARTLGRCRREPPAANRLDALAGLAFVVAMINLGHPRPLAGLLAEVVGEEEAAAVTSGVVGCLLARHHTTPGDPALPAFLAWRPAGSDRRLLELWERRVSGPGSEAIPRLYPALLAEGRLGDFTRFQRLDQR